MDKRSLLLGLGMGMIIGALLMQLFIIGEQTSKDIQSKDDAINGIQSPIFSSPEVDEQKDDVEQENKASQGEMENPSQSTDTEIEVTPAPTPTSTPVSSVDELNSNNENREYSDEEKFPNTILLRIYHGATVSQTAEVLVENEIIEDKDAFVAYVKKKKKLLRAGYFLINRNLTNDQALKILSGLPLTEEEAAEAEKSNKYDVIFSP